MIHSRNNNIDDEDARYYHIVNRISITIVAIAMILFVVYFIDLKNQFLSSPYFYKTALFLFSGILPLVLNRYNYHTLAKCTVSFLPTFLFLMVPVLLGDVRNEYFFWYQYAIVGASLIPLVVFSLKNEKKYFYLFIFFYLFFVIFIDNLLIKFAPSQLEIIPIVQANYLFYKMGPIIIFGFVTLTFTGIKNLNYLFEKALNEKNKLLQEASEKLEVQNEELQISQEEISAQNEELAATLDELRNTQSQLIQAEKMSSLGVLMAGVAHEINNPINFISSGLDGLKVAINDLLEIQHLYTSINPENVLQQLEEIEKHKHKLDYNELIEGVTRLMASMQTGVNRTTDIIRSLRTFSRTDDKVAVISNIHENLDSTLLLLFNQYKNRIEIVKQYGSTGNIRCFPGKLNQVFMNIISNAIQSIEKEGVITIQTKVITPNQYKISISDTGVGIPEHVGNKIFEPFFTTKDIGKGTGLGLSISYNIILEHNGTLTFESKPQKGSTFTIILPINISQ